MAPPSAFGAFSAFPVEIRRQIWHELLCKPVATLTPMWLVRALKEGWHERYQSYMPFDVSIFRCSKACGLEAMKVFYAGQHVFTFVALPSRWELRCTSGHENPLIKEFATWMPRYPTRLAARHIKNVWLSISIPKSSKDCFGNFSMGDYALCMPVIRKLQHAGGGVRGTCFVDLLFFCNDGSPRNVQVLGTSFFRGFKTLTAFEKVRFNISGSSRLAVPALVPSRRRPEDLDGYAHWDLKMYILQTIVEELEPVLGPANVVDRPGAHFVEFRPRSHLVGLEAKSRKEAR
ncbi:MAG: hypothetical protein ASARMPREDX12_000953 [Alectoria sarmentosa]|nr:MAG: hypothetical protein ASARMPREDX12_000953 [Alectoria sarmentosa]